MHRRGHIGVSLMFAGVIFAIIPSEYAIPVIGVLLFTEQLPDLDFKIPFVEHRGYSHTVWAAIAVATTISGAVVGAVMYGDIRPPTFETVALFRNPATTFALLWVGAFLGFVSHFAGDMITNGTGYYGVQPFAPLSQWESSIQLWNADSRFGNTILFAGGVAVVGVTGAIKTGIVV